MPNNKHITVDGFIDVLSDLQNKADGRFAHGGGITFSVDENNNISAEDGQGDPINFPGGGYAQSTAIYTMSASNWTHFIKASGTYVSGTTYYTDSTGSTTVDTTGFVAGETDVSNYYVDNTNYIYSFENTYPSNLYNISISACSTTTSSQMEAYSAAQMVGDVNRNIVTALGTVPMIDIVVMIVATSKTITGTGNVILPVNPSITPTEEGSIWIETE